MLLYISVSFIANATIGFIWNKSANHPLLLKELLLIFSSCGILNCPQYFCDKVKVSRVGDRSRGQPEGSIFNSYYTEVLGRALLLSLDCSILPLIHTLYCWVLSKEVSSTILKVFGMTWPGIEPRSTGPLANTLPTRLMSQYIFVIIFH